MLIFPDDPNPWWGGYYDTNWTTATTESLDLYARPHDLLPFLRSKLYSEIMMVSMQDSEEGKAR